jgi:hypothetical protein
LSSDHRAVTRPLTAAERQRLRTPANLWRALIPLLGIVGLAVVLAWPRGSYTDGIHIVDITPPIAAARSAAGFTVLAPTGLEPAWRPTSTEFVPAGPFSGATFRIGYVSPTGRYAEFIESNDAPEAVAAQYGPLTMDHTVLAGKTTWDGFRRSDGRQLIRHTATGVTVIVTGSAPERELAELAASLH